MKGFHKLGWNTALHSIPKDNPSQSSLCMSRTISSVKDQRDKAPRNLPEHVMNKVAQFPVSQGSFIRAPSWYWHSISLWLFHFILFDCGFHHPTEDIICEGIPSCSQDLACTYITQVSALFSSQVVLLIGFMPTLLQTLLL